MSKDVKVNERVFPHGNRQDEASRCPACGHAGRPGRNAVSMGNIIARSIARPILYLLHKVNLSLNNYVIRKPPVASVASELAVVSCLFNPCGSRCRVENFKAFQRGIRESGAHCLFVELAFGDKPFELDDDRDVIRLRAQDVLWHKERLLNIGIQRLLDEGFEKIAWLDGDILFDDPQWPQRVAAKLDEVNLCQVYNTVSIAGETGTIPEVGVCSVKYFMETRSLYSQSAQVASGFLRGRMKGGQSGFGWAARADVLRDVMLFDKAIVGGGDKLMLAASLHENREDAELEVLTHSDRSCEQCGYRNYSPAYSRCFMDWAVRWNAAVAGQVGYVDLHIRDMYHGVRADRKYMARREILYRHQFNPAIDLTEDGAGCLAWATDKPTLHHDVESYFLSRREDV